MKRLFESVLEWAESWWPLILVASGIGFICVDSFNGDWQTSSTTVVERVYRPDTERTSFSSEGSLVTTGKPEAFLLITEIGSVQTDAATWSKVENGQSVTVKRYCGGLSGAVYHTRVLP